MVKIAILSQTAILSKQPLDRLYELNIIERVERIQ